MIKMQMVKLAKMIKNGIRKMVSVPILVMLAGAGVYASDISVTNAALVNKTGTTYDVQFDIYWENSWFTSGAPSSTANWDAAWVFIKFSTRAADGIDWGPWNHATLNATGHTAKIGSQIDLGDTGGVKVGAFIRRSSAGSGTNDWKETALRWNFSADGVSADSFMAVKVFAIEMVYISSGTFYIGSGGVDTYEFYKSPDTNIPYQITSEDAITVANTAGNLWHSNAAVTTIPLNFPKGFNAFYIMKTKISQRQYRDFLNTLTRTQQATRFAATVVGRFMHSGTAQATPVNRNGVQLIYDPGSPKPRVYANNLNNNGVYNEADDGGWIACNWLSWADLAAYSDWAGLRPFSELEHEKACRGTQYPVPLELAWGTTNIYQATGISAGGTKSEVPSNSEANFVYGNHASVQGPLRSGCMARSGSTREQAGAGYFGVLDLSGNLYERPVTVGDATGRNFTGLHGNGKLDSTGNANVTNWPGTGATGTGLRGGRWNITASHSHVSNRLYAVLTDGSRVSSYGGRSARTSP